MGRECAVCGTSLEGKKETARFCSRSCEGEYYRTRDGKIGLKSARTCERCGEPFTTRVTKRRFCSRTCKSMAYQANHQRPSGKLGLSVGTVGTVSELLVAADLLLKGHAVFRALSPSCVCDLAVLIEDRLYRIEVTTGHVYPTGRITHPKKFDESRHDIIACVVHSTGEIIYTPSLPAGSAYSSVTEEVPSRTVRPRQSPFGQP